MDIKKPKLPVSHARRYLVTGIVTVIPIWITWMIFEFFFRQLSYIGMPWVRALARTIQQDTPHLARLLLEPWFQSLLAVLLTLVGLYVLGWATTRVVGRRLILIFDNLLHRIPLVQTVYRPVSKLISVLQKEPEHVQRVVLIEFPSPGMKAVGFVTQILTDADTGMKLAAVYVPTTPNPTSGYLEIVPLENVTSTDWTMDEAMTFIIMGGTVAPEELHYSKSFGKLGASERENASADR